METPIEYTLLRPTLLFGLCTMGVIWWVGAIDCLVFAYSLFLGG